MDFVDFNLAKKLEEKGFNCEYPFAMYNKYEQFCPLYSSDKYYFGIDDFDKHACIAPTISQVLKWLRKKKGLHIAIYIVNDGFVSSTISFKWDESYCEHDIEHEHYNYKGYSTYEEAAIAGIEYVLDNLI